MARRVLVTGGAGFIGSHVADRFVAEGWNVTVLDDLSSGHQAQVPAAARFVRGDIGSAESAALVEHGGFDVLCHLAAQIDVRRSVADPAADATRNILGTLNLMEAIRRSGTRTRVVFSSTGGALYGAFADPPSPEDTVPNPESPYGIGKLAAEHYLAYYGRVHGIETVVLRYGNVYGPRQDPHGEAGVVAIFCQRLLAGHPLTVYSTGEQTRDYVFVGDVAAANRAAATRPLPPVGPLPARAFNVGTGVETSVLRLASELMGSSGVRVPVQHAPARAGELARSALDIAKAGALLGWAPTVPLGEGLAATFGYFAAAHRRSAGA
jgi:UDP-glucose 4-epimerase